MNEQKRKRFEETLTKAFDHDRYVQFLKELLDNMQVVAPNKEIKPFSTFSAAIDHYRHIGNYTGEDKSRVALFSVCLTNDKNLENARSMQRAFVKTLLENSNCSGALVAFYTADDLDKWRLSLVRMDYEFSKGKLNAKLTPAKRYSYLVGDGEPCHTAQERLYPIFVADDLDPSLDELEEAFSVEAVTKDFFDQYREKYLDLKEFLDSNQEFTSEAESRGFDSEQFAKKLMGQIVFLYFIQKKGWLGVNAFPFKLTEREYKAGFYRSGRKPKELMPLVYKQMADGFFYRDNKALLSLSPEDETILSTLVKGDAWGDGPKDFMRQIFEGCKNAGKNFFDDYLEPLFYTGLNQNRGDNAFFPPLHRRVPFLNGGLFEEMEGYDWRNNDFSIPNELFSNADIKGKRDADGILDVFDRYNFTMAEDEPMEREVAIDPEMLGKVFENLLDVTDRKSKGAFYTPREIVHYMCQETIINYLVSRTGIADSDIRKFILYGEYFRDEDTKKTLPVDNDTGQVLHGDEIYYHKHHMEFDKAKSLEIPDTIFSYINGVNRLEEIDGLLANVKVVDPAVGSGAFPLGMLNEIVKARETITTYMTIEMNRFQRLSYRSLRNPYRLKRETIKNSIFACDIEASATDITKLRLWLSLVIDNQIMDRENDEFGYTTKPRELPNLDCNIICGNSLVDEFKGIPLLTENAVLNNETIGRQTTTFDQSIGVLINELIELQSKLYEEKDHVAKESLKEQIQNIYNQIVMEQISSNNQLVDEYYQAIQLPSKPFILWQLYFPKVFRDNGGFDIVIGNPPYFNVQTYGAKAPMVEFLKRRCSEIWMDKSDILFYFIYLGSKLTNDQVCFITSNAYLFSDKGKKFRNYLVAEMPVSKITNFENYMVFNSASITSCITEFKKKKNADKVIAQAKVLSENSIELSRALYDDTLWFDVEFEKNAFFALIPPNIKRLNEKIKRDYPTLGSICKVGKGMETAANSVFLFNEEPPFPKQYIKRRLTGEMVNKYVIGSPTQYLLYYEGVDDYDELDESIKEHLTANKEFLENRATVKNEGRAWWKYSRPMHKEYYDYDKIWCSYRSAHNVYGLDTTRNYIGFTNTTVVFGNNPDVDIKYILALLNSKLLEYFHKNHAKMTGGGIYEYFPNTVDRYPIPLISKQKQKKFVEIVDAIIAVRENNIEADIYQLQEELDKLVFELYEISDEEIEIIERKIYG